ncbi:hypothetical protein GGF32_001431 [Allomyces javanicus]|nr:hypothetical protein GGF32_001431 [Allomyces javanicus]
MPIRALFGLLGRSAPESSASPLHAARDPAHLLGATAPFTASPLSTPDDSPRTLTPNSDNTSVSSLRAESPPHFSLPSAPATAPASASAIATPPPWPTPTPSLYEDIRPLLAAQRRAHGSAASSTDKRRHRRRLLRPLASVWPPPTANTPPLRPTPMLAAILLLLARLVAVADLVAAVLVADRLDWPLAAVADAVLLSAVRVIALLVPGARRAAHVCAASAVYAVGKASILLAQPTPVDDAVVAIAIAAIAVPVAEASLLAMHLYWTDRGQDRDDIESRSTESPTTPSPPPRAGGPPRRTSAVVPDIRAPLLHGTTGGAQTYKSFHAPDAPSSLPPPPPPPPRRRPSVPRTNSPALNRWSIATFDRDSLNAYMAAAGSGVAPPPPPPPPPPRMPAPAPPRFLMHAVRSSLDVRSRRSHVDEDGDEVTTDDVSADEEVERVAAQGKMGV